MTGSADGGGAETVVARPRRSYAEHVPAWQRFQTDLMIPSNQAAIHSNKNGIATVIHPYQRQYAHVYHQRLAQLGPVLWERIRASDHKNDTAMEQEEEEWIKVERILELREDVPSAIVGTLVVEKQEDQKTAYLEDESGRVALAFSENLEFESCTGIVLGLVGTVGVDGVLQVAKVYTGLKVEILQEPTSVLMSCKDNAAPYVLLVSGLECGSPRASSLPRDMLVGYIQGQFGISASKITNVIIAGGLVCAESSAISNGARELDAFAWQLTSAGIPVTVLPGKDDPTTANWPQRPIHKALMPHSSSSNPLLSRSPNPCAFKLRMSNDTEGDNDNNINTRDILGTDGTNVIDLALQTSCSELDALQKTVEYAHICPTGPDSVPTMPHAETDPMVLLHEKVPAIYFAGNCTEFATRLIQVNGEKVCRLVCLPKFLETGKACLVNLETLCVELVRFEEE